MRELKILLILVAFTLVTYYGIEPFAHKEMHAHVEPVNFDAQAEDINLANLRIEEATKGVLSAEEKLKIAESKATKNADDEKLQQALVDAAKAVDGAKKDLDTAQNRLSSYQELWSSVKETSALTGNAENGAEAFSMSCVACHGVKSQDMEAPFDDALSSEAYGVVVPDLSDAGAIYDKNFLAALIINPAHALKLDHKFNDDRPFPMTPFGGVGEDFNQDVADIVAYLRSIAPKEFDGKEVFESACLRCHDLRYDKLTATSEKNALKGYVGSNPPDISTMIRSRGAEYLETFINDPQKNIAGTAMPRVGLNEDAQEKLMGYLEQVGDSTKDERKTVGFWLIGFFAILSVLAYLWKQGVWRELH
ncbi:MAG: c-type cytochrome [Campylobacteraceae bacterium]|jgi:ubiquinol-cytochrome c reductase cytochrome c1 subunit|nr:c-type cytochrome [Campylobacteraceae bacterium]